MITGHHCIIRTADPDDARALSVLYNGAVPRAAYLNRRREILLPTVDELRESLSRKDRNAAPLYVVEDLEGRIRGLCALSAGGTDTAYGEIFFLFSCEEDFAGPVAREALAFLCREGLREKRLNKIVAQSLETEPGYRQALVAMGFESNGVQREVLHTQGRYFDLETLTLAANAFADPFAEASAAGA